MANDVEKAIEESAKGPKRASGDSGSVEQHSLREQIEVDKYLAVKRAGRNPASALVRVKLIQPGTA
jgi:hypothetical protein